MSTIRAIWAAGLGVVLMAFLQGCGGGGDSPSPSPGPPGPPGPAACPESLQRGQCTKCLRTPAHNFECLECAESYAYDNDTKSCSFACPHEPAKPAVPSSAKRYNGIAWPTKCIGKSEVHFFTIGDWGGVCNWGDNVCKVGDTPKAMVDPDGRPSKDPLDSDAQMNVAKQMATRAAASNPEFVINVGDNFYPGGIDAHCGDDPAVAPFSPTSMQFKQIYEDVYVGDGLAGKEWWSVLGNHDYGGVCFVTGWDQQIFYTWGDAGRWLMPAQYWSRKVQFRDFTADFIFMDTNFEDAWVQSTEEEHNICGRKGNTNQSWYCGAHSLKKDPAAACKGTGPTLDDCPGWFEDLNTQQRTWVEKSLKESEAEWQIVVTHYPPRFDKNKLWWRIMAAKYGIDLIIAGHTHEQHVYYFYTNGEVGHYDLGATAWVVSGGGGGITSTLMPMEGGHDDAYGFMDMTINKDTITIEAISHGGVTRNKTVVTPRPRVSFEVSDSDVLDLLV